MHTDHSHDCATPVEVLLATARERGLGAIAVTDHNEISGALDAQAKAAEYGVKVILAEEVKTASQGEVIGLFIKEKIPRGHDAPGDGRRDQAPGRPRLRAAPVRPHARGARLRAPARRSSSEIDLMEIFNPRVAIGSFNEEAARFAAKYRIPAGAGSDAHVAQGLGTARVRMRDFDGPEEFLASIREGESDHDADELRLRAGAEVPARRARPPRGRARAVRQRRVKRAARKG